MAEKTYIWVCTNTRAPGHPKGSCGARGGSELRNALKVGLVKRRLTDRFRVCESSCLDLCHRGIALALSSPEGTMYGDAVPSDAEGILDGLQTGCPVARLRLGKEP